MAAQSPRVQDNRWKIGLLYDFRFEKARLDVPAIFECFCNITTLQRFRHFGSPHSHRASSHEPPEAFPSSISSF
jgi:hypothetical protein